ncbi:MAG: UDP-N-acetylmuramate dehydrogenase [Candidatus Neomarinimicrobiota bacterium]
MIVQGSSLINEPMAKHTSWGIGGPVLAFVRPESRADLTAILALINANNIPMYIAGSGSNLLVSDEGFNGIIISLAKTLNQIRFDGTTCYAEAGVMLGHLVKESIHRNLTGLESLGGVPGTLGGALVMNAGAYGSEISNCLVSIDVVHQNGVVETYKKEQIEFDYRRSSIKPTDIVIAAEFQLKRDDPEAISLKRINASSKRRSSQPLRFRSAGSVFKNPKPDLSAGFLIDKAGLKGMHHGDAEISEKHGNFFLNRGEAKAEDIMYLIQKVKKVVKKKFNIELELEIKTLGFEKEH